MKIERFDELQEELKGTYRESCLPSKITVVKGKAISLGHCEPDVLIGYDKLLTDITHNF